MKLLIILLLITQSTLIFADYPVMLEIQSKSKVSNDFRDGVEEILTSLNYSLVDKKAQEEALKNQSEQRNSECYDDSCLVDTGKMLAAKSLIIVEVEKKGENSYKFKARFVDFERGTTTKTVSKYYEFSLNNYKEMMKFGKKLTKALLVNYKAVKQEEIKKENLVVKKKEKRSKKLENSEIIKEKENRENKKLKEEIRKLKSVIENKKINPRKKYKWGIAANLGLPTLLGGVLNYRLIPSIDLSLYVGVFSGFGIDYHLFANTKSSHTIYFGGDLTIFNDSETTMFYPHLGYQYIIQNGFYLSTSVGMFFMRTEFFDEANGEYYTDNIIFAGAGIKLGYSF
jgi:hypothetical protein